MDIGFTGTQKGMTQKQKDSFYTLLKKLEQYSKDNDIWLHHGDCIGADADAVHIVEQLHAEFICSPFVVHQHPPINDSKRAFTNYDYKSAEKPYLERNKDIVQASTLLIATPAEPTEQLRSGTWSTIRHARRWQKERPLFTIFIIYRDGTVERE
jgi:hypothetical protein